MAHWVDVAVMMTMVEHVVAVAVASGDMSVVVVMVIWWYWWR